MDKLSEAVLQAEDHQNGCSQQPHNDYKTYSFKNSLEHVGYCCGIYCSCAVGLDRIWRKQYSWMDKQNHDFNCDM